MGVISRLVEKKWWKILMARLYGWGASVVMIGALMKLEHFKHSSYFLIAGLGTEAVIFFFSAFEKQPEDYDWTLVHPVLAKKNGKRKENIKPAGSVVNQFDDMLAKAEITPELFQKLGNGLQNLSNTAQNLSDISDASVATKEYAGNVKQASESLSDFSKTYQESTDELKSSASNLTKSYVKTAELVSDAGTGLVEKVSKSSNDLTQSYQKLIESINKDYTRISQGNQSYGDQLEQLNKNLGALNTIYEMQVTGTDAHTKITKEANDQLSEMMGNLKESVAFSQTYRQEVESLGQKLVALNQVYGNMLSAMNVRGNS